MPMNVRVSHAGHSTIPPPARTWVHGADGRAALTAMTGASVAAAGAAAGGGPAPYEGSLDW